MIRTRRQWLRAATMWPACLALQAGKKEFWESKDPASWSNDEKQALLQQSPWAREGFVRMELDPDPRTPPGYSDKPGADVPGTKPINQQQPGGVPSYPIGEKPPRVPKPDKDPLQFRVLARWESAKPVRLAGGPEVPELTGQFYVIRLRGLPLMPPKKAKPGEAASNPNEGLLQAIKAGTLLERNYKRGIPCSHIFTGSGDMATEALLFFPRGADPITAADKVVTLEGRFDPFHLVVKFPLKDMKYKGELAL